MLYASLSYPEVVVYFFPNVSTFIFSLRTAGKYCYGDSITMADCCLVPQIYNATRFSVDLEKFPTIARVGAALNEHPAVKKASPEEMPDAQK